MSEDTEIINEVAAIYQGLDTQIAALGRSCRACGNCCDFDGYGHRLYVSTPELIYLRLHIGPDIRPMPTGVCPYRIENKCTIYPYRFSGCRIFDCAADGEAQSRLSESILRQFKDLCDSHKVPYRYLYVKKALNVLSKGGLDLL